MADPGTVRFNPSSPSVDFKVSSGVSWMDYDAGSDLLEIAETRPFSVKDISEAGRALSRFGCSMEEANRAFYRAMV